MGLRLGVAMLCVLTSAAASDVQAELTSTEPPAPALVNLSMRATPLELIREIGLQTRVPIGIIPGQDANALCRSKSTFVFLGDAPRRFPGSDRATGTFHAQSGRWRICVDRAGCHAAPARCSGPPLSHLPHRQKVDSANDQRAVEREALDGLRQTCSCRSCRFISQVRQTRQRFLCPRFCTT